MNTPGSVLYNLPFTKRIHWGLLVFLILFLNVKLIVKLVALLFIYVYQPNFQFGFSFRQSKLPLFYPLVILIAILNTALFLLFLEENYLPVLSMGIMIWLLCILAVHQVRLVVETTDPSIIYDTLKIFFLLNSLISLLAFLSIVMETGAVNPFRYQGEFQKYFISTGDYIKGISFDTSTTNAIINACGVIFFLSKRSWLMVFVCTATLLLTASNLVNLILFSLLFFLLLFKSTKDQKSIIVACFGLLAIFMTKVSPQNNQYFSEIVEKVIPSFKKTKQNNLGHPDVRTIADSLLTTEQRKEKIARQYLDSITNTLNAGKGTEATQVGTVPHVSTEMKPVIPPPDIHSPSFQNKNDTNSTRKELITFLALNNHIQQAKQKSPQDNLPGKAIAYLQTGKFIIQNPRYLVTGAGIGNFSSKVAFKATSLNFAGGFPKSLSYVNPSFSQNHLGLYLFFFSEHSKKHSIVNSPNSVYNQLIGEYGLAGLIGFLIFYVGFFARHQKKMHYALPLLFLLIGVLFIDYWFEQLSVVVFFELLFFLDMKENTQREWL